MSTSATQSLAMVPRDKYGNDIMSLSEFGLDGTIRCSRVGGRLRFARIDVAMVVTGKNNNRVAEMINNMSPEVTGEVTENSVNLQFKGPGQKTTTLITYTGVIKLIMSLPGANAKFFRAKFAELLLRYFAGDESLVEEIESNKVSSHPINEMAREEIAATGGTSSTLAVTRDDLSALEGQIKEAENRLVLRCPTIAAMNQMKEELVNGFIRSDKSKRRMQLNDEAREHKRKMELIEKETVEMGRRLPIAEQYDVLDERKFQRKMQLLEKENESKASHSEPVQINGKFTTSNVATCYNIYDGLDTVRKNRVFNTAWRAMLAEPYNLKPLGYVEDTLFGKREPFFHSKDVHIMKSVLENMRKDVLASNIGE